MDYMRKTGMLLDCKYMKIGYWT